MTKVIGVKFPHSLKIYDFIQGKNKIAPRDQVVVETTQGVEVGTVVYIGKIIKENKTDDSLSEIIRVADEKDLEQLKKVENTARDYYPIFIEKIEKYNLQMSPVGVGCSLDETRVIFYFTAEGRIDFRDLAKDLSRTIQKQAVLRQIGPRDEAKLIGGFGRCGRPICCTTFLLGAEGVTMETVEQQYGMPKNAAKVSGICGRLMCCLNYEIPEYKGKEKK